MRIIIYSETNASRIATDLGKSEYSYFFILKSYLPILEKLGSLVYVEDPASEVDTLYAESLERGESAVFLSFSPPHRTQTDLQCPTVCVLAWEFSSVPDEDLGRGPQDNWVEAISRIGNIITISKYSSDVIGAQLGDGLNLMAIPAPVTVKPAVSKWEMLWRNRAIPRRETKPCLVVSAEVIDSLELDIRDDIVCERGAGNAGIGGRDLPAWDNRPIELYFDGFTQVNNGYRYLTGFHDPEDWGAWARSDKPWINLPYMVSGDFVLTLELVGFGENDQRSIGVTIGDQTRTLEIDTELRAYVLRFSDVCDGTAIIFSNLKIGYTIGAELLRALSIGVGRMLLRCEDAESVTQDTPEPDIRKQVSLELSGLVYTAIFNPEDGRKNWEDILKAFCWAFRNEPDKTLILKLSCPTMTATWGRLLTLFSQLNPFQCRIVVIHGFLQAEEMAGLIDVTDYIVNASHAEGQCLPLLEFMAEGVPAIAPDHTAMASYINSENALVVRSWRDATCWPQDERQVMRTFFYRIDWASLLDCFVRSAEIAEHDSLLYEKMSFNAANLVRKQFSLGAAGKLLKKYLRRFA